MFRMNKIIDLIMSDRLMMIWLMMKMSLPEMMML